MILVVLLVLLIHDGFHIDQPQLTLHQVTPSGVRLGVVLALFSFVGFESATTLGHEARNPLRTIPRAVVQSAVLAGLFFLLCCYTETLGFRQLHQDLGKSDAPYNWLPYIYLGYLAAGLIYFAATPRSKTASNTGSSQ
jgi:amino acid transporter